MPMPKPYVIAPTIGIANQSPGNWRVQLGYGHPQAHALFVYIDGVDTAAAAEEVAKTAAEEQASYIELASVAGQVADSVTVLQALHVTQDGLGLWEPKSFDHPSLHLPRNDTHINAELRTLNLQLSVLGASIAPDEIGLAVPSPVTGRVRDNVRLVKAAIAELKEELEG